MDFSLTALSMDRRVTMPHRRTSGAKVRSHKIGIGKSRFKSKQARLHERKNLMDDHRNEHPSA
jgi:hypothetical protein